MSQLPERRRQRLDRLAYLLDNSIRIPGIGYRIGYDALIGLIPGVGDVAGLLLSAYIVLEASRFRLPRATLGRMVANVAIEAIVGAIPLLGDVFDATWKANARNLDLLNSRLERAPAEAGKRDRSFLIGVALALLVLVVGCIALAIWVVSALLSLF